MSKKSSTFARQMCVQTLTGRILTLVLIHKRPKIMASIQDIHALEERIYDAVQE